MTLLGGYDSVARASWVREAGGFRPSLFRTEQTMMASLAEEGLQAALAQANLAGMIEMARGGAFSL